MKRARFRYHAPKTIEEAVDTLAEVAADDGRVLAGGQSLVPIMAFRLARPAHLVDINGVDALRRLAVDGERLTHLVQCADDLAMLRWQSRQAVAQPCSAIVAASDDLAIVGRIDAGFVVRVGPRLRPASQLALRLATGDCDEGRRDGRGTCGSVEP